MSDEDHRWPDELAEAARIRRFSRWELSHPVLAAASYTAALVAGWLIVALATGHLLAPGLLGLLMGGVLAFSLRYALYRRRHRSEQRR